MKGIFKNNKTALVLGGGGARGIAHIAVIEYLENLGIPVNQVVGCSIGSIIGAAHCCGTLQQLKDDFLSMDRSRVRSLFDPVFPRYGLLEGRKAMDYLKNFVPDDINIEDLPVPLAIVATDLYNARTVVFTRGNLHQAIRASISIPGIFEPVRFRDSWLIDGGATNPLPINVARKLGAGITIAVNLNGKIEHESMARYYRKLDEATDMVVNEEPVEYMKKSRKLTMDNIARQSAAWLRTLEQWLRFDSRGDDPHIFDTVARTVDIMGYTATRLMLKYEKPTVLVEPDVEKIGILEFERAQQALTEGFLAIDSHRRYLVKKVLPRVS